MLIHYFFFIVSTKLRVATVPLIADEICRSEFYNSDRVTAGMFCAGYREGKIDTCGGDSGGGLVCLYNQGLLLISLTLTF